MSSSRSCNNSGEYLISSTGEKQKLVMWSDRKEGNRQVDWLFEVLTTPGCPSSKYPPSRLTEKRTMARSVKKDRLTPLDPCWGLYCCLIVGHLNCFSLIISVLSKNNHIRSPFIDRIIHNVCVQQLKLANPPALPQIHRPGCVR